MNLRDLRDILKIVMSYLFIWLYVPHIVFFIFNRKKMVDDLIRFREGDVIKGSLFTTFIFHLHNNSYYRTLFYHRCGPILGAVIG